MWDQQFQRIYYTAQISQLSEILKILKKVVLIAFLFTLPSILSAQYIDTKWTVTEYFGELWFAEEEDILGKQQEFYEGWADDVFYSCQFAGQ